MYLSRTIFIMDVVRHYILSVVSRQGRRLLHVVLDDVNHDKLSLP